MAAHYSYSWSGCWFQSMVVLILVNNTEHTPATVAEYRTLTASQMLLELLDNFAHE